jgi:acyl carrier protein
MAELEVLSMFEQIAHRVEKGKKIPPITRESQITALGIDSLSMMEIIGAMEDELGITIPDDKLSRLQTVGDIERVVKELKPNA